MVKEQAKQVNSKQSVHMLGLLFGTEIGDNT
jgi:hypothetical protein